MARNKYHAKRLATTDGAFDSRKEFTRWQELLALQRAGEISDLRRQVRFHLLPPQRDGSRVIERGVDYIADFVYTRDGAQMVEDVKGVKTPEYIIKRKLMLYQHGIKILEV